MTIDQVWKSQGHEHKTVPGRVSIIVTAYNKQRHVANCIEHALHVVHHNLEIIVVNDGSTDGTLKVIEGYKHYPNLRIIDQPNQKSPTALNNGIKASTGEFYVRSDADDWLEPDYVAKTMPRMAEEDVAAVCTSAWLEGDVHYVTKCESFGDNRYAAGIEQEMSQNWLPNGLIRLSVFLQTPGWNPQAEVFADWNMWIDITKMGWKIAVVDEPLTHYRIEKGLSATNESATVFKQHGEHQRLHEKIRNLHPDVWPLDKPAPCLFCKKMLPNLGLAQNHRCEDRHRIMTFGA